jgi:hypothetical protein
MPLAIVHSYTHIYTFIPPFSRVRISRFHKLAGTPQEYKHVTPALQWIAASELFDSSNRSSSCTTWCSRGWRGKSCNSYHSVSANKRETLKIYWNIFFGGGGGSIFRGFSQGVLEPNPCEKQGMSMVWPLIKPRQNYSFILQILVFIFVSSECWAS